MLSTQMLQPRPYSLRDDAYTDAFSTSRTSLMSCPSDVQDASVEKKLSIMREFWSIWVKEEESLRSELQIKASASSPKAVAA